MDIMKPLTTEEIANANKKINMSLDDIIKMSKKKVSKIRRPRISNKIRGGFLNRQTSQVNSSSKVHRFIDSWCSQRQAVLAQRRSNFRGNQFPLTTEAARKAVQISIRERVVNWKKPMYSQRPAIILAQRRSHFRGNQFPPTTEAARKQTPIRKRVVNWNKPRFTAPMVQRKPDYNGKMNAMVKQQQQQKQKQKLQTMDLLFADLKERRQSVWSQQMRGQQRGLGWKQQRWIQRGRRGATGRFFQS